MATLDLECPAIVETRCTGFVGAASRYLRSDRLRVEWYAGRPAILTLNGRPVVISALSRQRAIAFTRLLKESYDIFKG